MERENTVPVELLPSYRKAGRIAAEALKYGASLIKVGVPVVEVLDKIEARITELGGQPAFPAQISINEVAAHYCPSDGDRTVFTEGDIVKLDVGVHVDGCIGDNALTVDLSTDGRHAALIAASKEARDAAIKLVRPGVTPHEIGTAVHEVITSRGFQPIKNLSGHGLGLFRIHTPPSIPNYPNGDLTPIPVDSVIAIEPFATTGQGVIYSGANATLFAQARNGTPRSAYARAVLKHVTSYKGLPFTTRWITRAVGQGQAQLGLRELLQQGVLHSYPPLPEKAKGLVSQSEHTVLVRDKPEILTTCE